MHFFPIVQLSFPPLCKSRLYAQILAYFYHLYYGQAIFDGLIQKYEKASFLFCPQTVKIEINKQKESCDDDAA
ncbi:hypothetical protein GCM10009001_23840 [Virgibacillus siamensis]|uniref:Uncharacterized protein n=1 Tax=Virgibacillus siamensis TaxID=480071 RepID=A0ABN1G7R8_9BACI